MSQFKPGSFVLKWTKMIAVSVLVLLCFAPAYSKNVRSYGKIPMTSFLNNTDLIYGSETNWDWNDVMRTACERVALNISQTIDDFEKAGTYAREKDHFGNRHGDILDAIQLSLLSECQWTTMHDRNESVVSDLNEINRLINPLGKAMVRRYTNFLLNEIQPPFDLHVNVNFLGNNVTRQIHFDSYADYIRRFDHEAGFGNFDNAANMALALYSTFGEMGTLFNATAKRVGDQVSFLSAVKKKAVHGQSRDPKMMAKLIDQLDMMIAAVTYEYDDRVALPNDKSPSNLPPVVPVAQNTARYRLEP